ncbi:hypothetical protein Slin15195_G094190 [Septoria linicola]|uniref:Uncharacterized protein n=1 Tax=Septoria linicola TaxID=215465 RepID=A0A9Q9EMJ2_9PEZI|nr:hypothetical protein Slin14017_G057320 [Septoria linicola]USW56100.1 hypothetical protein Slin15195_G094190 [Septoria linicola]
MSLLQTYYARLARKLREQYVIPEDNDAGLPASRIRKAILGFPRNSNISDILDPHHMFLSWYIIYEKSDTGNGVYWAGNHSRQYASDLARDGTLPSGWWAPAEKLAKSAYSTVLVDLGNSEPSNLLLDGEKLQNCTSDFNMTDQPRNPGPATRQYDPLSERRTRLGATPATTQANYICNKPRRKPTGAIVWLVILADIVFLQALWVIYKLIIDAWVSRHVDGAENCNGCQSLLPQHKTENIKMLIAQIGAMGQAPSMRDHPTPAPAMLPRPERK